MPLVTRKTLILLGTALAIAMLLSIGVVWSGVYNIGADDPHWRPTRALLEAVRHRSIDARASKLQVPTDLANPARIQQGAGNYEAMCTGCHLKPGMSETELSKGLYPAPPDLTKEAVDLAHAFWVIKHGIKASGMPAWGKSMEDDYVWNMAAFVQQLPTLDAKQYQALVAGSGGHSHGGGETKPHGHAEGTADDHNDMGGIPMVGESKPHAHAPGTPAHDDAPKSALKPHTHAPGTPPHHDNAPAKPAVAPTPSEKTAPEPAAAEEDSHDEHHQH